MASSPMTITYIDVRFLVHATEDPEKTVKAVRNILPTESIDDVTFKMHSLQGHYGNPILLFQTRIVKQVATALAQDLFTRLEEPHSEMKAEEPPLPRPGKDVYLRFDKQAAFEGKLQSSHADPIHLHIRFKRLKAKDVKERCQEL
ncbi:MAG: hypothetical protein JSV58_06530 [Candidatus Bathyarchaeota archaeon]|nr:MAG: hypothetical protein JSV58_06530 [Candidatus Bathyarchaeota archaeon]